LRLTSKKGGQGDNPPLDIFGSGGFEQGLVPTDFLQLHELIVGATAIQEPTAIMPQQDDGEELMEHLDHLNGTCETSWYVLSIQFMIKKHDVYDSDRVHAFHSFSLVVFSCSWLYSSHTKKCVSVSSFPGAVEYARRMSMKDESAALKYIRSENLKSPKIQDRRSVFPEQAKWLAQLLFSMNAKKVGLSLSTTSRESRICYFTIRLCTHGSQVGTFPRDMHATCIHIYK
jgi:hypothetical protein